MLSLDAPDLTEATIEWMSAILDSADVAEIGVSHWWPRARAAMETAAASADTYAQAVSVACKKLQIETLAPKSAGTLTTLEAVIGPHLDVWRELAQRDAVYLVALVQVARAEQREVSKAAKAAKKPSRTTDSDQSTIPY